MEKDIGVMAQKQRQSLAEPEAEQEKAPDFEIIKSPSGAPIYTLAVGDPDSVSEARSSEARLLDALPEGCHPEKYRYMWVPKSSIPLHTQAFIDLRVGKPVDPEGHPEISRHLFTNGRYETVGGEQVLWYFQKESFDKHYNDQPRRRAAVGMFRQGQGHDPDGLPLPTVKPNLKK